MSDPLSIIERLFPSLVEGARFAHLVQHRVEALEEKAEATNIFAAALSDADLSIQNHVELSLLAHFPKLPFFGEEWKSSRNTKYLAGSSFVEGEEYLVTLDPVDGTRPYLDGQKLYQIILNVVSRKRFEGAIVLFPAYGDYVYALRGKGAFRGSLDRPFSEATAWRKERPKREAFLGGELAQSAPRVEAAIGKTHSSANYRREVEATSFSALLRGELCAAALGGAQIIDGAALAFVAEEMGFIVRTFEGGPIPPPVEYPELVLPGLIVAEIEEDWKQLRDALLV